jgi:hypothetical protein
MAIVMTGDFYGLPTRIISNQHLRLEFLAEAGPRIVRLSLAGSDENLLAEVPDVHWTTPYGEYHLHGGHRLWHAPDAVPRSSVPDNSGLMVKEVDNGVSLCQPSDPDTRIRKCMEIYLHPDRPALMVRHELFNGGAWPVELAPWAITQLPLGGVAILPQKTEPIDSDGVMPNRHLVLWPYTHWHDPRLRLGDELVLIEARSESSAFKVGYMNSHGWVGYLRAGVLFVKHFQPCTDQPHADLGCNVEVYCSDRFIELETLASLSKLEPGQSVTHVENWEIHTGHAEFQTLDNTEALKILATIINHGK